MRTDNIAVLKSHPSYRIPSVLGNGTPQTDKCHLDKITGRGGTVVGLLGGNLLPEKVCM